MTIQRRHANTSEAPHGGHRRSAAQGTRRRRRAALSRERIIRAALNLIDEHGLKALNMRDLGTSLDASTMSIYRHFRNKTDLLDAIVDQIIAELIPTSPEGPWQVQIRTLSLRVRSAILAHPDLAPLFGLEFRRSPTSLRVNAEIIERFRSSGVPPSLLAETYWAVVCYTNGYTLLEAQSLKHSAASRTKASQERRARKLTEFLQAVDGIPERAVQDAALVLSRPIDDEQFLFGLDCLIKGIEEKVAAQTEE